MRKIVFALFVAMALGLAMRKIVFALFVAMALVLLLASAVR